MCFGLEGEWVELPWWVAHKAVACQAATHRKDPIPSPIYPTAPSPHMVLWMKLAGSFHVGEGCCFCHNPSLLSSVSALGLTEAVSELPVSSYLPRDFH